MIIISSLAAGRAENVVLSVSMMSLMPSAVSLKSRRRDEQDLRPHAAAAVTEVGIEESGYCVNHENLPRYQKFALLPNVILLICHP